MRTQTELVEGDVLGGLTDSGRQFASRFQLWEFGRHETEYNGLVVGNEPQRSEVAGAFVVVLEEVGIDVEFREQHLGDGFVSATGEVGASEVAATQVDADCQVTWPTFQ